MKIPLNVVEQHGGQDLLGRLERQAHKRGMKFGVCFLGLSANTHTSSQYPEWVQRNSRDRLIEKWPGYQFRVEG